MLQPMGSQSGTELSDWTAAINVIKLLTERVGEDGGGLLAAMGWCGAERTLG